MSHPPPPSEPEALQADVAEAKHHDHAPYDEHAHANAGPPANSDDSQEAAAQMIQRNYRGYRERRQLAGMGLDANTRWAEAIKEARWRNTTRPMSRSQRSSQHNANGGLSPTSPTSPRQRLPSRAGSESARQNWKRISEVARRAGADDPEDPSEDEEDMDPKQREEYRKRRAQQKAEREKTAKMMDLQYFLEMVDQKHRYGSNLRAYHDHWKKIDTNENFFYWLDYGEGKHFEHPTVSRERLEKEQVRYLSREERMKYLVKIDKEGRLCWAKNGERITTSMDYKDSVEGIVPKDDVTPAYASGGHLESSKGRQGSSSSSSSSDSEGEPYVNNDLDKAKGLSKLKHVSAATILNHLLRGSVKPNSWIFVADTSFRLYCGIKQSGAFQHSSFLHGSRISAAGLIRIKDGQLRRLSPLSGHYRPPTSNFRAFVHSLKDNGVDMSRVSISRSYAVLVGLEAYTKTRKKFKHGVQHASHAETRVMHPDEYKKRMEEEKDKSKSAQRERQIEAANAEKEEAVKKENSWRRRVWRKVRGGSISSKLEVEKQEKKEKKLESRLSKEGQDVESAIPPAGKRDSIGA